MALSFEGYHDDRAPCHGDVVSAIPRRQTTTSLGFSVNRPAASLDAPVTQDCSGYLVRELFVLSSNTNVDLAVTESVI